MESNGAPWVLVNARQDAQGKRLDTLEAAVQHSSSRSVTHEEVTRDRLANVERDVASIKTTLKVVAGAVAFLSPLLTAVLVRLMS